MSPGDSNASLPPNDVLMLESVATAMVTAGLWQMALHFRDLGCDYFEIQRRDAQGSKLSIGVLASGRYFYMDHRSGAVGFGATLAEVLELSGISVRRPADRMGA